MRESEDNERNGNGVEEKSGGVTRREFLEMGVAATLGASAEKMAWRRIPRVKCQADAGRHGRKGFDGRAWRLSHRRPEG